MAAAVVSGDDLEPEVTKQPFVLFSKALHSD